MGKNTAGESNEYLTKNDINGRFVACQSSCSANWQGSYDNRHENLHNLERKVICGIVIIIQSWLLISFLHFYTCSALVHLFWYNICSLVRGLWLRSWLSVLQEQYGGCANTVVTACFLPIQITGESHGYCIRQQDQWSAARSYLTGQRSKFVDL